MQVLKVLGPPFRPGKHNAGALARRGWKSHPFLVPIVAALALVTSMAVTLMAGPAQASSAHRSDPGWALARTPGSGTRGEAPLPARNLSNSGPGTNPEVDLNDLSCATPKFCVAVGDYEDADGSYTAVIETLTHGGWAATPAPEPATNPAGDGPGTDASGHAFSVLFSVSCPTAQFCAATGTYHDDGGRDWALTEVYTHGSWHAGAGPMPGIDPSGELPNGDPEEVDLSGVNCPVAGWCVAVGAYPDTAQYVYGLLEIYNHGKWTPFVAPQPSKSAYGTPSGDDADKNQFAGVGSVSCTSVHFCAAVGYYKDDNGAASGLIETYVNGKWHATAAPEPTSDPSGVAAYTSSVKSSAYGALVAVNCPYAEECTTVGSYRDNTGHNYGLVDTLVKGHWKAAAAPEPKRDLWGERPGNDVDKQADSALSAVACPAGKCVTVGFYKDSRGYTTGLVDVQAQRTWRPSVAPEPSFDALGGTPGNDATGLEDTSLSSVSCLSVGLCIGVGSYNDAKGNSVGLIDTLSRGRWHGAAAPAPRGQFQIGLTVRQVVLLSSVSCTHEGTCSAVGSYQDPAGNTEGLIVSYGP